jgi:hypothetical protein
VSANKLTRSQQSISRPWPSMLSYNDDENIIPKNECMIGIASLWIDKPFSIYFDLQLPLLVLNIFSCFSNHQGPMFIVFLLLSLPSSVLQWHHERCNFFSEYDRSNDLFYVGYYTYVQELLH